MQALAQFWLKNLKPKKEKKVLSVIYRGSDYRKKKAYLHYIQPDIKEYIRVIEEKQQEWGYTYDKIFLATESLEVVEFFREKFRDKLIYVEKERVSDSVEGYIQQEYSKLGDFCESQRLYYVEMRIAAACDDLISGICACILCCQGNE